MNLQFLSIGQMNGNTAAFFFNKDTNRVVAFPVDDYTGTGGTKLESIFPPSMRPPAKPEEAAPVEDKERFPDKPKSIVPPGMMGLMRPEGPMPAV